MHETAQDIATLQDLLDRSYRQAGQHLLAIHGEARRLKAAELVARLQGMCLLVVTTVSKDCRPVGAPLDGVFHRGAFYFGTDPSAVRWRHLRVNPSVSATYLPSEDWSVTVHGRALPVDVGPSDPEGLRSTLIEVYTPPYTGRSGRASSTRVRCTHG